MKHPNPSATRTPVTSLQVQGNANDFVHFSGYSGAPEVWEMINDFALVPEPLWRLIFWKIDTMTIARVGLASNQWKTLLWRFTVQLEFGHDTGDTGLFRRLVSFLSLESLTIYSSEVANRALMRPVLDLGKSRASLRSDDLSCLGWAVFSLICSIWTCLAAKSSLIRPSARFPVWPTFAISTCTTAAASRARDSKLPFSL